MVRVSVDESNRLAQQSKGISMFSFETGKQYLVIFLGEQVPGETYSDGKPVYRAIMYMNPTHNVKGANGKGYEVRCANKQLNFDSNSVVKVDKEGNLLIDPVSKRPVNDGTCPYCIMVKDYSNYVFKQRELYMKKYPDATEKQVKAFTKKMFDKSPVKAAKKNTRVLLAAIIETDTQGNPLRDTDGNIRYRIQAIKFSENRYNTKLLPQVQVVRRQLDPKDDGLAWHEYYFYFPSTERKNESGMHMSISFNPNPILPKNPQLFKSLLKDVKELNLDELENQIYIFRLKSLAEMERDIALYRSKLDEIMDKYNKEDTNAVSVKSENNTNEIPSSLVNHAFDEPIPQDVINTLMGDDVVDEITDDDIANLM